MRRDLLLALLLAVSTPFPCPLLGQVIPPTSVSPAVAPDSAVHHRVVSVPPGELLKILPTAPDHWDLKQSTAKNFFMEWISSQAQREFSYAPPATPDAPPPPVHVLHLTITDTGYYAGLMSDLLHVQPPKSGEAESLTLGGYPARRIMVSKTQEQLRILVRSRYVIQIDVQNEPPGSAQRWWTLFDQTKLAALPIDGDETLPRPFSIVRIDELNPRNNTASKGNFTTQDEAERTSKPH